MVILFVTLPFGVRRVEKPDPGTDAGAPESPRLGTKALVTTVIAAVMTITAHLLVSADLLPIREWLSP